MTPERLAQIEARCNGEVAGAALIWRDRCLELVAALREAQVKNQKWAEDFKKLAHECGGTELERQALAATLERVEHLHHNWAKHHGMWDIDFLTQELRSAIDDTDGPIAYAATDGSGRSDTEQQQQQINAAEGEEH